MELGLHKAYCTTAVRASDSVTASSENFNQWVGVWRYVVGLARHGSTIYSTDCCKAMVSVLVSFFVALWFILRGDLF